MLSECLISRLFSGLDNDKLSELKCRAHHLYDIYASIALLDLIRCSRLIVLLNRLQEEWESSPSSEYYNMKNNNIQILLNIFIYFLLFPFSIK